jgi:hypothetical protein
MDDLLLRLVVLIGACVGVALILTWYVADDEEPRPPR